MLFAELLECCAVFRELTDKKIILKWNKLSSTSITVELKKKSPVEFDILIRKSTVQTLFRLSVSSKGPKTILSAKVGWAEISSEFVEFYHWGSDEDGTWSPHTSLVLRTGEHLSPGLMKEASWTRVCVGLSWPMCICGSLRQCCRKQWFWSFLMS